MNLSVVLYYYQKEERNLGKLTREEMDRIEQIVDRYFDMIYRIAFTYTKAKENAEDICQEVFERYMKKMPAFENEEHEKAWVIRVTINAAKNFLNTAWIRRITSLEDQKEPQAVIDEDKLVVTYTIQYEKEEVNKWGIGPVCATQIDGKPCGEGGDVMPASKIAKNQYQGYFIEDVRDCYKGGKAECEVQFESLQVNNETILGDWKFKFIIEDKKLVANTLSAKLNKILKLNGGDPFVLKEMKNNATGATIRAKVKPKEDVSAYFIAGTDQNGKDIYFAPIECNLAEEDWTFTMMDIERLTRTTLDDDVKEVNVAIYYLAPDVTGKDLKEAKEGNQLSKFVNIKLK